MELIQSIKTFDLSFYSLFSNRIPTSFGCLYYNSEIPESFDSNHAHITNWQNPEEALEIIEAFYLTKGIRPRIYGQSASELETLRPFLKKRGYQISAEPCTLMVRQSTDAPLRNADSLVTVRVVNDTEQVASLFHAVEMGDWNLKVVRRCHPSPRYRLFAAFIGDQAVSMASLQVDPVLGIGLVSNVMTRPGKENRGYCTRVMEELVSCSMVQDSLPLYLYTSNPAAKHVYQNVGFVSADWPELSPFSAWKDRYSL